MTTFNRSSALAPSTPDVLRLYIRTWLLPNGRYIQTQGSFELEANQIDKYGRRLVEQWAATTTPWTKI